MRYNIKGLPFEYKGSVNVSDCKTSEEVMIKANLNWTVNKCQLIAEMPNSEENYQGPGFVHKANVYKEVKNAFATYIEGANIPLGYVKSKYTIVQNTEAFKFFDKAIGENEAIFQTAGCFGRGERIFVSVKLPNTILVNKFDPVDTYLVFTTSHDGSSGVRILFTPIRVTCQNTLNAAIKTSSNFISFRHTNNVHDNIDRAHEVLGITKILSSKLKEEFNYMSNKSITDDLVIKLFSEIILTQSEQESMIEKGHTIKQLYNRDWYVMEASKISTKKVNTMINMYDYYHNGIGQKEIIGTQWGAYNAVTGYYSNVDNQEGEKRMDSLLYGDRSNKIAETSTLLLENYN